MKLNQLTNRTVEINRIDYLIWGMVLMTIKFTVDRITATAFQKYGTSVIILFS